LTAVSIPKDLSPGQTNYFRLATFLRLADTFHRMNDRAILTRDYLRCPLCQRDGRWLYRDLTDRLFSVPGQWNIRQCSDAACGLHWLDPQPLETDIAQAYQSYFTHQTDTNMKQRTQKYIKDDCLALHYGYHVKSIGLAQHAAGLFAYLAPFHQGGADTRARLLSSLPRGRTLDVGCGDGQLVEFIQGLGWRAEGVDFDRVAVEIAKSKGLTVSVGMLREQHHPDDSFDTIILSHFIEHVHDFAALLLECRRILRTGGRILILTPNADSWAHRKFGSAWFALDPPRHLHIFTNQSLRALVERSGLKVHSATISLRNLGTIITGSCAIRDTGRFNSNRPKSLLQRYEVGCLQIREWLAWQHASANGEELTFIVEKTGV